MNSSRWAIWTFVPAAILAVALCAPATSQAEEGYFATGEAGVSYLAEWSAGRATPGTAALGVRAGYRWQDWDVFGVVDQASWFDQDLGSTFDPVLNVGVGVGLTSMDGYIRSSARLGTSTLLFDTRLSSAGTTGLFTEIRPAGFRLPLDRGWTLEFHPFSFALSSPVLTGIPLLKASYRTSLGIETHF